MKYHTIVLGLGAMGSATLYQLAKKGVNVLGIDQFKPPHTMGSTHGDTRITRQAIGEGEQYPPLAKRANELWHEIENESGQQLLTITGGLVISNHQGERTEFFEKTVATAEKFNIPHEILHADQIRSRFPQLKVANRTIACLENTAGFLRPEACVQAQLDLAKKHGAEIHANEKVLSFEEMPEGGVIIKTDQGEYQADHLVIAAGPWVKDLLGEEYDSLFTVTRQVQYWFDIDKEAYPNFTPDKFPIFIWQPDPSYELLYGFPAIDGEHGGIKIASGVNDQSVNPDTVNRQVSEQETQRMFEKSVAPYFKRVKRDCLKSATCMYTSTPDFHFIIDKHPTMPSVEILSPCSGHGFKYSAAIGEIAAQRVLEQECGLDLSSFQLSRFKKRNKPGMT